MTAMPHLITKSLSVGQAVALCRVRVGLSKRALSERAGLSASYVQKVEAGEIEPSFRAFAQLAVALNMSSLEIQALVLHESMRAQGALNA